MDPLDRLNEIYDGICGKPGEPSPTPSLEAIQHWLEQHRERETRHYMRHTLDAAVENVDEARRLR